MPAEIRLLHGERRPSQINHDRPKPPRNLPVMPTDLSPDAAKVWRRVVADYGATGALTRADTDAFRIYCEAVARYQTANAALERGGLLIRGARSGDLIKNPLHQIVRDAANLVRAYAGELGLTPASRTNIVAPSDGTGDDVDRWMAGAG